MTPLPHTMKPMLTPAALHVTTEGPRDEDHPPFRIWWLARRIKDEDAWSDDSECRAPTQSNDLYNIFSSKGFIWYVSMNRFTAYKSKTHRADSWLLPERSAHWRIWLYNPAIRSCWLPGITRLYWPSRMTSQECEVCNQYNSDILQGKVRRLWVPGRNHRVFTVSKVIQNTVCLQADVSEQCVMIITIIILTQCNLESQ